MSDDIVTATDWSAPPELWWHPYSGVVAHSRVDDRYFALGMGEGPIITLKALPDGAVRYVVR